MTIIETPIDGLLIIEPKVFKDERGCFFESWNKEVLAEKGFKHDFVQDNQSSSVKNVLRGLHFQVPPYEQGKLVRVVTGSVLDVAVDLRRNSKSFGKHYKLVLNGSDNRMLWIPPGFAHGFLVLENDTIFVYKCTKKYHRESERAIIWNDPYLSIDWEVKKPLVSPKDMKAPKFKDAGNPF